MQLPGLPALPSHGMHPSDRENAATAPTGSRSMGIMVMLVATESEQDQLQDSQKGNFKRALSPEWSKPRLPLPGTYWAQHCDTTHTTEHSFQQK